MKINFNPVIKYSQANNITKIPRANQSCDRLTFSMNGLDCISSYNMPFCSKSVYQIDYDGNCIKYPSIISAAEANSCPRESIKNIVEGKFYSFQGLTFAYAEQVETNGEIDPEKLKIALLSFKSADNQPIYSIDASGAIEKHVNISEASQKTKVSRPMISQVLTGARGFCRNYTFIKAFDVEKRDANCRIQNDENGNPILDMEAINKAREAFLYKKHGFPIVRIDINGETKIYNCIRDAADDMKHSRELILQSIERQSLTKERYTFVRLSDVVLFDKNKNVVYDENNNYAIDSSKVEIFRRAAFEK